MPLAEDEHPVGDLGPGGEHEPFRMSVRLRAPGRDLHYLHPGAGKHRVERLGELPGPITDQEPEVRCAITQIHQQIPCLLHGPGTVRVRGHAQDVDVPGADFDHEEDVDAAQRDRAVHVEEARGEHRRCLGVQELPPGRVGGGGFRRSCRCAVAVPGGS